jgi:primosomal protein N' (replication factor Y)
MTTPQQPTLFTPPGEAAPARLFAQVVFNHAVRHAFTYAVPEALVEAVAVGKRVLAPFGRGNKTAPGYCVALSRDVPERAVKSLLRVLDDEPLFTPVLLELTRWMADYYLSGWGQVLNAVIPAGAKQKAGTREVVLVQALIESELPGTRPRLTPKQTRALDLLRLEPHPVEVQALARAAGVGTAVVLGLVKKGYARRLVERVEQPHAARPAEAPPESPLVLNPDQLQAFVQVQRALNEGGFQPFLLHGVTGSGKTEIYLQAIQQVVSQGKEALVLVPEISLTPQTIRRFRGRFSRTAVLHSHLTDAERGWHWRQIAAGQVQVIVGARSAIFAPTRKLGLIVVDEEHEGSFKQEATPRYHGRDVAVMRSRLENIPILLGSATPSLESWHNAVRGHYRLLSLPTRVLERPLPHVGLIDLRHEPPPRGQFRALSPTLERAVHQALEAGGQVILLLNRRGFATHLLCPACGHVVKCRFCDVALTHHRLREVALCHYCGFEQPPPERCPECGLSQVRYLGQGTEKLEAEIAKKFPGVPAQRMDSDTMRRPGSHAQALDAFRKGETRILLGTQMIAKGLDFPNVTLVGVINADTALNLPDFRAAERTFQLLAQVAGRTGRGPRGGTVLVQTFNPEHPCIALAAKHDFVNFARAELTHRKEHQYPPYSRMARLIVRGKEQPACEAHAQALAEAMRAALQRMIAGDGGTMLRLLGPAEAPLFRLKGYFRYHFQIQSTSAAALHALLRGVLDQARPPAGIDVTVDIDPLNML